MRQSNQYFTEAISLTYPHMWISEAREKPGSLNPPPSEEFGEEWGTMSLKMKEILNQNSKENAPEKGLSKQEKFQNLGWLFTEAENVFEKSGRELAKGFLPQIYDGLMELNGREKGDDWTTIWVWNPEGELTQEEFDALNLRRKLLSNAIGIKNNGVIRHDLNEI